MGWAYWQHLIAPQGRYHWLRLPCGIKCAPEFFQRKMDHTLEGIEGVRARMDVILVAASTEEEPDEILACIVAHAAQPNLTQNFDKCQIKRNRVNYGGHTVTANDLEPNKEKVKAIQEMPEPRSKEEIRWFLGMVQYLGKFIPGLSERDAPLRDVSKKNVDFYWLQPQQ